MIKPSRHAIRYLEEHGLFTFTSVTLHEIVYGLELKSATSQLNRANGWLNENEEITRTSADYLTAARMKAAARRNGYAIELPDCLIASVAARVDRPLVNGEHRRFHGSSANRIEPGSR